MNTCCEQCSGCCVEADCKSVMRIDLINTMKTITKEPHAWFIYAYSNAKKEAMLNYMLYRFKGRFTATLIISTFSELMEEFAKADIDYMKTL